MKNQDSLQQFAALRSALVSEREAIQKRLQSISDALGGSTTVAVAPFAAKKGRPPGKVKRVPNTMSLREAVLKVLTAKPITRHELLAGVEKAGYRFASSNPLNSLQTFLYGTGKKLVKNVDGTFAAAGATNPAPAAPKKETAKPVKAEKTKK